MKKICLILLSCVIGVIVNAQSIIPLRTDEYCPSIEYTFNATINNTYSSMIGVNGAVVTVLPSNPVGSSFTFKGTFDDANKKQGFRVNFTDNTYYVYEFTKIKSLYFTSTTISATNINPNIGSISAPRCQISNYNLSFNNAQFFTNFESPDLIFGTITAYEYLLPFGWKLNNGLPSNGSNWELANNSVTITSDLSNGINGSVLIRAVNPCSPSLTKNLVKNIPIFRPAPIFDIPNPQSQICNGQNANYTITGLPSGSTVQWSVSNNALAQIITATNNPTINLLALNNIGVVTLTATITHCSFTYQKTQDVQIGVGVFPQFTLNYNPTCGKFLQALANSSSGGTIGYRWNINGAVNSTNDTYLGDANGGDLVLNPFISNPVVGNSYYAFITIKGITGCGITNQNPYGKQVNIGPITKANCKVGPILRQSGGVKSEEINYKELQIFPNPAVDNLMLYSPDSELGKIVQIVDLNRRILFNSRITSNVMNINISNYIKGFYVVRISNKSEIKELTFVKQ